MKHYCATVKTAMPHRRYKVTLKDGTELTANLSLTMPKRTKLKPGEKVLVVRYDHDPRGCLVYSRDT